MSLRGNLAFKWIQLKAQTFCRWKKIRAPKKAAPQPGRLSSEDNQKRERRVQGFAELSSGMYSAVSEMTRLLPVRNRASN
jgi:hypothetical protein